MMQKTMDCPEARISLGVYVLGAMAVITVLQRIVHVRKELTRAVTDPA